MDFCWRHKMFLLQLKSDLSVTPRHRMMKTCQEPLSKKLPHVPWQPPDWLKEKASNWRQGLSSSPWLHSPGSWAALIILQSARCNFRIWSKTRLKIPLFTFPWLFVSSFTLLLLLPSLSLLPVPSFSPSAWQGQPSAHGEWGCSRRHLWKRELWLQNLSSDPIPGQGGLAG